ncbi:MAG: hypothetical protein ACR2IF_18965 [Terriglobales bacterium]
MKGKKEGLLATLLALLVLAGAMTIIGIIVWMRMSHTSVPSQPGHTELRVPSSERSAAIYNLPQETKVAADYI